MELTEEVAEPAAATPRPSWNAVFPVVKANPAASLTSTGAYVYRNGCGAPVFGCATASVGGFELAAFRTVQ